MSERQQITEEMDVHKEWYVQAEEQTLETLPEFIRHITEDYEHDYGTCVHAVAVAAIGAAWAAERPLGITGFQAGCVMWKFIQEWTNPGRGGPLRLISYIDMLYPQYADSFDKTITTETWEWLQKQARENLVDGDRYASGTVIDHWRSIADGIVPFGYRVVER